MSGGEGMIRLTRVNSESFYLNPDLIQEMETTPDTVLTLSSGARIVVQEAPDRVIDEVVAFRKRLCRPSDQSDSAAPAAR
jgi:flagellar protein FlbD